MRPADICVHSCSAKWRYLRGGCTHAKGAGQAGEGQLQDAAVGTCTVDVSTL